MQFFKENWRKITIIILNCILALIAMICAISAYKKDDEEFYEEHNDIFEEDNTNHLEEIYKEKNEEIDFIEEKNKKRGKHF